MENIGRPFTQVAAMAGITPNKARVAVYLMGLAQSGRSLADTAAAMKRKPDFVKRYAREFMIDFPDYRPFSRAEAKGEDRPEPRITLATAA
jgi:hypothetical protein